MPTANLPGAPGLKRDAGRIGLLFASLSGMIGSGWLFGALNAARIAGPASIFAWIIGGIAILLLAFVYAELTTMFPRPGAVIVFPKLCHGMLAAQVMSWINFLAYVSVAPVEAVAVVSYGNHFLPGLVVGALRRAHAQRPGGGGGADAAVHRHQPARHKAGCWRSITPSPGGNWRSRRLPSRR